MRAIGTSYSHIILAQFFDDLFINFLAAIDGVLVRAAFKANVDIVELLLNAGARIDDVDNFGNSACHFAAVGNRVETMRLLLTHRPNLALRNLYGKTVLQEAIHAFSTQYVDKSDDLVMFLIRSGASLLDLNRGDWCRLAAISKATLQLAMDRNVVVGELRDEDGCTPLHHAVFNCTHDLALLSMLVNVCGVDLDVRDNEQVTCTAVAVARCGVDALRFLLLAGAQVNNADAEPLLHTSVVTLDSEFKLACTMLVLAAGADVAARDVQGRTACLVVAWQPEPMSFVHAMVAAGADLDAADYDGQTPRLCLSRRQLVIDPEQVELMRREIAKMRLDIVRHRALQICIGLQSRGLDALQMCEILVHACGPMAQLIAFHQWWTIVTIVKHFKC
jgi:ankyrin repeat protein